MFLGGVTLSAIAERGVIALGGGAAAPGPVALEAYIQVPSRLKGMSPSYGGNPVPPGGSSWPVNMLQVNAY